MPLTRQPAERLILAGAAILLLILGAPQAAESIVRLAGGLDDEAPASIPGQMRPIFSHRAVQLESLDEKFGDPQARIRAGLLRLRLAVRPDTGLETEMAEAAIEDLRRGLARAPANPLAWTALAHAELALGAAEEARKALDLSLSTAPQDPALILSRCQIGLALWADLSQDERERIVAHIARAWAEQPQDLLALARAGGYGELVAAALETTGQREAFEKALAGS